MPDLKKDIKAIKETFQNQLEAIQSEQDLENIRIEFLSRQGSIAQLLSQLKSLSAEDKKTFGPLLNNLKKTCLEQFNQKKEALDNQAANQRMLKEKHFDVTAYRPHQLQGSLHPITLVRNKIENVFISMGYTIADGPEIENNYYNFEALNIPESHPARDMWDTFYLDVPGMLLRTHTSNVQIHMLEKEDIPLALIAPGRCYRHEATDASHDYTFMQVEGLFVSKNVSLGNLLATIKTFLQAIFEKKLTIRVRPSYFPFVEPGIEVDMSCPFCKSGCSTCKKTRWIEICGAGLVHPNVLEYSKIDASVYSGFAFGFGLTRLVMLKYGISDIRLLHSAKVDFLKQF